MGYSTQYYETNRDLINSKRRQRYDSEARKEEYRLNRVEILQKKRDDRTMCPLCSLSYGRFYLKKHLITRHKMPENVAKSMYNDSVDPGPSWM